MLVGDRLHVIDLDEARQGDPAFDLGHFSAYADLLDGEEPGALAVMFLDEYAAVWMGGHGLPGVVPGVRLAQDRPAVGLRSRTVSGGHPRQRRSGVEQALAGGLRCLSR